MSEAGYVELPILQWLSGQDSLKPNDTGLGWTYRDEEAMAAFDRPLEDPLVEKLLVEAIIKINPEVTSESQARLAVSALRKAMVHPDKLTVLSNGCAQIATSYFSIYANFFLSEDTSECDQKSDAHRYLNVLWRGASR